MSSDDNYLDHISGEFEPDMVGLFKALATDSITAIDVGANIGCTSLLFSTLARDVYAFEPSKTTFSFLRKNIERSGATNVHLVNIGLGDKAGEYPLTFSPTNRSGGFVSNQTLASVGHVTEAINIETMDSICSSLNIPAVDFIKIDVEGFEASVLRGGKYTIQRNKPTVVLELNHWCLNAFQRTSVPDFLDELRSIFPILLAVEGKSYMNLHDTSDSYIVMYNHILRRKYPNIIAAFSEDKLSQFRTQYSHRPFH
ncbi:MULTISPECIES: FkbM family methyltransferase [Aphanothece]|uniref:FkbM family methyltransferase n=1 Tax=Aphanothece TaxID=1121 RepID=UPI003984D2DA